MTAVSDDAAAASLRRTRLALSAGADARRTPAWGWGLAAAATAGVIMLVSVSLFLRRPAPAPGAMVERRPVTPAIATAPPAPGPPRVAPVPVAPIVVPARVIRPEPLAGVAHVEATSAPRVDEPPRPDPLIALVRAVQQIPEDAWQRSAALAAEPVSAPDVSFSAIDVAPLETPPIADASIEPLAPGEP